jgi:hypothetical protein
MSDYRIIQLKTIFLLKHLAGMNDAMRIFNVS